MIFQVGTQLLDACVLAIVQKEDVYGYFLTQNLKDVVNISESTLYPVLRRMQKEELLMAYDMPYSGRNRRYYKITDTGREQLSEYVREWEGYKVIVDKILLGGAQDEQA